MGKRFDETTRTIKFVLSRKKYLLTTIITAVLVFSALYYLIVAKVANNELWISVMMSGAGYVTFSIVSIALISALFGIYLSMVVFKIVMIRAVGSGGFFGIIGGAVGAFGVGCPTCGAFLFSLIGAPLALMYLPFRGLELQALSVVILVFSIYFTGKSINAKCEINPKV
jgi:hypothetical protein